MLTAVHFPLHSAFAAFHKFCFVVFLFSFISAYFLISFVVSFLILGYLRLCYLIFTYLWIFQFPISDFLLYSIVIRKDVHSLFLHFPPSAGISVGLGWNHHHLPLPSYWILCSEVWKGNLNLSSFVVTLPFLLYGQVTKITFSATSVLPCWPFILSILNFTWWLVPGRLWSGRVDDKARDWGRCWKLKLFESGILYKWNMGMILKTEWSLRIMYSKDQSVIS